jgi:hypothetical protein
MKTKNLILFFGILLLSFGCSDNNDLNFTASAEQKFYYAYDKKIFLYEVENKAIIACESNYSTEIKNAVATNSKIEKVQWLNDSICVIIMKGSSQYQAFKEDFIKQSGVKSIQPIYTTNPLPTINNIIIDASEMGITDEFVVNFKENVLQTEIDKLHEQYRVSVKKINEIYQLLSIPVDEDALEVANAYQESGLVEFSHPNFILKIDVDETILTTPVETNLSVFQNQESGVAEIKNAAGYDINILDLQGRLMYRQEI